MVLLYFEQCGNMGWRITTARNKNADTLQLEPLHSLCEECVFVWVLACCIVLHSHEKNKGKGMLPPSKHVQKNFESWTFE